MNSGYSNLNTEASESDLRRLLQDIKQKRVPTEVLLEDEIFKNRLRLITMAHARTPQDAEDLANDVRIKVWRNIQHFKPDYRRPYDGFFSWLRAVTRNTFIDTPGRRCIVELDERRVEDLDIADTHMDIEQSLLYKEVMAEFEKSINALPRRERLAVAYYLQGFTFRETSEKMRQAGFSSSHVTVHRWIRDGLSAFFPESANSQNIRSKNVRLTKVRATRAKREIYSILEQAINSGTAFVMSEDINRTPLVSVVRHKGSETAPSISRPSRQSANDLLKSMQRPESKRGIEAAFDASPEALGQAAVEHANKRRKIPVGSLTTFLMAASTVNVVGRVMNLSKDAA